MIKKYWKKRNQPEWKDSNVDLPIGRGKVHTTQGTSSSEEREISSSGSEEVTERNPESASVMTARKPAVKRSKPSRIARMRAGNALRRLESTPDPMDLVVETSGNESDHRRQTRSQTKRKL